MTDPLKREIANLSASLLALQNNFQRLEVLRSEQEKALASEDSPLSAFDNPAVAAAMLRQRVEALNLAAKENTALFTGTSRLRYNAVLTNLANAAREMTILDRYYNGEEERSA